MVGFSKLTALRLGVALVALAGLSLSARSSANAAGAGAQVFTQTFHKVTEIEYDFQPCSDPPIPGRLTLTENGVFHVTELTSGKGAGTFWATGTVTGDLLFEPVLNTLAFDPNDPEGGLVPTPPNPLFDLTKPTFTGHFTAWFGDNDNLRNGTETSTFSVRAVGSDGSTLKLHETFHMSVSASGVEVSFDKAKETCG